MKRVIYNTFIILYAIIAILVTICLLSFNQYRISEFDSTSLIIINTTNLTEKGFKKGDLVFVDTTQKQELGDDIFFHTTSDLGKPTIDIQKLKDKQTSAMTGEVTYILENKEIPSGLVIGATKNASKIGKLGTILNALESKWGFLILIVFPSLLAFLYELWEFIANIRNAVKNEDDDEEDDDDDDEEEEKEEVVEKKPTTKKTSKQTSKKTGKQTTTATTNKTTKPKSTKTTEKAKASKTKEDK